MPLIFSLPPYQLPSDALASGAYSGLFRMPTTHVVREGELALGFANGSLSRELSRSPADTSKTSIYSVAIGFLPGLEVGASFMTASPFNGIIDDRSTSFKYALLSEGRAPFSLAFGTTDMGGTRRRATDYVVAGKRVGGLNLYGGVGRGLMQGVMAGASLDINQNLQLMAERTGGTAAGGVRVRFGDRWTASAGLDEDGRPQLAAGISIPLGTRLGPQSDDTVEDPAGDLARRLAALGRGAADVQDQGDWLVAKYDDVEARDPVTTLGEALRLAVQAAGKKHANVRVVVRRFGRDLVSISGPMQDIRSFFLGWTGEREFLNSVTIEDGSGSSQSSGQSTEPAARAGRAPTALVTVRPTVDYQLGRQDVLPNRESIDAKVLLPLPYNLFAAAGIQTNVNNSIDDRPTVPSPALGLYHVGRWGGGFMSALGVERSDIEPASGTLRVAYYPPNTPFRFQGDVARPLEGNDKDTRYALEAGVEAMRGTLSLWARHERFSLGDKGETMGATRRFGQTWVSLFGLQSRTKDTGEILRRVGVNFEFPLPGARVDVGPVRVATAPSANFVYQPTIHAQAAQGRAIRRVPLFSPDGDLSERGQLTAWFVRQHLDRLRKK